MRTLLVFTLLLITNASLLAQAIRVRKPGLHELGGGAGIASYHGDLAPGYRLQPQNFSLHGFYRRNISPAVTLRLNASYQRISANSMNYPVDRYKNTLIPLSFSTPVTEFAALMEYNFFDFRYEPNRHFTTYLIMGFGMFRFNVAPVEVGGSVSQMQPCLPLGLGYKRSLSRQNVWSLHLEFITRKTFTDYLDNVSDKNPATNLQRGEPGNTDWYGTLSIGLSYTFYQVKCATPFNN